MGTNKFNCKGLYFKYLVKTGQGRRDVLPIVRMVGAKVGGIFKVFSIQNGRTDRVGDKRSNMSSKTINRGRKWSKNSSWVLRNDSSR